MRGGESEDTAPALLLHEDEQTGSEIVITEGCRFPVEVSPPEGKECTCLGRSVSGGPDMPRLIVDLRHAGLVVAVLQLRGHRDGYPHLGRI